MAREPLVKMIGEGFRECGVLVFVFAILDKIIYGNITLLWTVWAVSLALGLFTTGLYLERKRSDG